MCGIAFISSADVPIAKDPQTFANDILTLEHGRAIATMGGIDVIEDQKNYTDEKHKIVVAIRIGSRFSGLRDILSANYTI